MEDFRRAGPSGLAFEQTGGPALNGEEQAELKAAIQAPPREAGIELSNLDYYCAIRG